MEEQVPTVKDKQERLAVQSLGNMKNSNPKFNAFHYEGEYLENIIAEDSFLNSLH